jgi:hypothetical protein
MDEYELLLKDIEEILLTVPEIRKVSHSKPLALGVETHFPAVYINPLNGVFDSKFNTKSICGYDDYEYVRLIVNMHCDSDLDWVPLRGKLIKAILDDSAIWKNIINRDIVTWANDDFDNYPLKQFELGFEFRIRAREA